jgi:hypothetical protein
MFAVFAEDAVQICWKSPPGEIRLGITEGHLNKTLSRVALSTLQTILIAHNFLRELTFLQLKMISVFMDLPAHLQKCLLIEWLEVNAIIRLDTTFCSKQYRSEFTDMLIHLTVITDNMYNKMEELITRNFYCVTNGYRKSN